MIRVAILALVLAVVPSAQAIKVIPPQISELLGSWLGQSDNGEFVRLQLYGDGSGALAVNYYPKNPIWIYQVQVTKPKGSPFSHDLEFKLTPLGDAPAIELTNGKASRHNISFKVADDPFDSVYALTPEQEALNRIIRLIGTHKNR